MNALPVTRPFARTIRASDLAILSGVLAVAYVLKRHYSNCAPEDLGWILTPTTYLVEIITGARFTFEPHVGYLSKELALLVAPACAGVNFLIVCTCSLSFGFVTRLDRVRHKLGWALAATIAAFSATVLANASRITIGVLLHTRKVGVHVASAGTIHRLEGTVVYVVCLLLVYFGAERSFRPAP